MHNYRNKQTRLLIILSHYYLKITKLLILETSSGETAAQLLSIYLEQSAVISIKTDVDDSTSNNILTFPTKKETIGVYSSVLLSLENQSMSDLPVASKNINSANNASVLISNPWFIAFVGMTLITVSSSVAFSITLTILCRRLKNNTTSKHCTSSLSVQAPRVIDSVYVDPHIANSLTAARNNRSSVKSKVLNQKPGGIKTNSMCSNDAYMCSNDVFPIDDINGPDYAIPYCYSEEKGKTNNSTCVPNPAYNVGSLQENGAAAGMKNELHTSFHCL